MFNEVLVVEGKNDKACILAIFPSLNVITTNGSEISEDTLDMIEELSHTHKIILFLDPDYPGERIRSKILERVPTCDNVFIKKSKAIDHKKHKVGVEHASDEDIKEALENRISYSSKKETISNKDLFMLGLVGANNSALKRLYISERLHIGQPNGKTFLNRLNMLEMTYEKVRLILDEKNWND